MATVELQKEVKVTGVTLELSLEEAEALAGLLGKMRSDSTPLNGLYRTLYDTGVAPHSGRYGLTDSYGAEISVVWIRKRY